jgi:ubiquinone/menaquinone biosynthesis C-methylase UbiE
MSKKSIGTNPFFNPEISLTYEDFYQNDGRRVDHQEKALLKWLLTWFKNKQTILEVGCGTGHFTRWFGDLGLQSSGLDISRPMLDVTKHLDGSSYVQGDALMLPFPSSSYDLVSIITTLEFVKDPLQALGEAMRVARVGLILGVINARSCIGRKYKHKKGPIWRAARFFVPLELEQMILNISGNGLDMLWCTTLWPR